MPDLTITTAECGGSRLSCHTLAVYLTWHRDGGISGDSKDKGRDLWVAAFVFWRLAQRAWIRWPVERLKTQPLQDCSAALDSSVGTRANGRPQEVIDQVVVSCDGLVDETFCALRTVKRIAIQHSEPPLSVQV